MSNFKSTYATDTRVESTVHIISHYLRAATNKLGAKKAYTDYFVMTGDLVEELIKSYQNRDAKSALVIDDVGLQVINRLVQEGAKDITLALARVPEENLETVKYIIHNTFPEFNIKIVSIEETKGMNVDLVIANPPYGKIGAEITKKIIDTVDFKEYINLEPGNDYFINYNYKYIDQTMKPIVLGSNAFSDASQATTITKISKQQNNLTQTGARLLVSIQNKDEDVYKALSELWLNTEKQYLKFTQSKRDLAYDEDTFVFNPGAFDIHNGYFAVAQKNNWTSSTEYNIYHKDAIGHINLPKAKVRGCLQFKKLVYSELGLKMLKLWFTSSSEGWGFAKGMFADIDYSDCLTWNDVFTKLNVSEDNQKVLIEAAEKFELNNKEKEICKIAKEIL